MDYLKHAFMRLVDLDLTCGDHPPVKVPVSGRILLQLLYPPGVSTLPRGRTDIGFGFFCQIRSFSFFMESLERIRDQGHRVVPWSRLLIASINSRLSFWKLLKTLIYSQWDG